MSSSTAHSTQSHTHSIVYAFDYLIDDTLQYAVLIIDIETQRKRCLLNALLDILTILCVRQMLMAK